MTGNPTRAGDDSSRYQRAEPCVPTHSCDPQSPSREELLQLVQQYERQRRELEAQNEDLRNSQRQLERYRDRYVDLYDFAPLGYVTLDEDGYVQEINLAGARLLGTDRDSLIGYPFADCVLPEDRDAFLQHVRNCVHQSAEATSELTLVAQGGRKITAQLHSIPVQESAHEPIFCKTAITDITRRRQAEEQLRALNETLEQRVAQRTAEADQRAVQLRALASQLSLAEQRERHRLAQGLHDHLQQLLIVAKIKVAGLKPHLPGALPRETVAQVVAILEDSIAESRSLGTELSPPVLYDAGLAAGLEWLARHIQQKHRLTVETRVDAEAEPALEGTRVFLFQAVRELLANVVEHAQTDRAWVEMSRVAGPQVRIEVRDEGVGFDPARLRSPASGDAVVLGLFSIRERLEFLGGRLEIDAAPGRGSRVVLWAPLQAAPAAVEPAAAPGNGHRRLGPSEPAAPSTEAAAGVTRVLLADDHPLLRKGLVDLLGEQSEIQVVGEAGDGEEAVSLTMRTRPDVVLMDVSMPKLSGIEATRRIKAQVPGVRVIGLSMYDEGEIPNAMRDAGVEMYLSKNVPAETLIAAVLGRAAESLR